MKKIICCFAVASLLLSGCSFIRRDERAFIMERGPEWAWKTSIKKAVREEYERLQRVVTNYANDEIQDYQLKGIQDDINRYNVLSFFDMEMFYSGGVEDRNKAIKRYKDRYSSVLPALYQDMMEMTERLDSLGEREDYLTDDIICTLLVGNPGKISRESKDDLKTLARNIVVPIRDAHEKPSIASCEFDPFIDQWDAILSNGSHLYVMVIHTDKNTKRYFFSLGHPYEAEE